jgi:hypothetical protein
VESRGRLGLVERKGDEWTAAALVRLAVTVGGGFVVGGKFAVAHEEAAEAVTLTVRRFVCG